MSIRVRINNLEANRHSVAAARELVDDVLRDARAIATNILSVGPYTSESLLTGLESEVVVEGNRISGKFGISGRRFIYAAAVERGAAPHIIRPRPPRKKLRFYWRRVGRVVYPSLVHHPGQEGKRYLRSALLIAGTRHGMRVVVR